MVRRPRNGQTPVTRRLRSLLAWLALGFLYTSLALAALRATPQRLAHAVTPDAGDPVFGLYLLDWVASQVRGAPGSVWDLPIFFPVRGALALSEHLLGPGAVAAGLRSLTPNPILVYNLLLVLTFPACGLATAWVLRQAGMGWFGAAVAGAIYAFSPYRFDQLPHYAILRAQWVPLVLWWWHRLLAEPTWRRAVPFLLAYGLHASGGAYLTYMIHVPLLVMLVYVAVSRWRELTSPRALRVLVVVALAALALLVALYHPYLSPNEDVSTAVREVRDWRDFGGTLASYVRPGGRQLYGHEVPLALQRAERLLFAGVLPTLLAALGFVTLWRGWRAGRLSPRRRWIAAGLGVLALVALALGDLHTERGLDRFSVLGLGLRTDEYTNSFYLLAATALATLVVGWGRWSGRPAAAERERWERGLALAGLACFALTLPIVLVHATAVLPGLDRMRVPSRFYVFVSFAIAWFAARGGARLGLLLGRRAPLGAALLVPLLALDLAQRPAPWVPLAPPGEPSPAWAWLLEEQEVRAALEVPVCDGAGELVFLYRQLAHRRPLVNGYSGVVPDPYLELCRAKPRLGEESIARLRAAGVSHVVVNAGAMKAVPLRRTQRLLRRAGAVRLAEFPAEIVWALEPAGGSARLKKEP